VSEAALALFRKIGQELLTQDNAITADPIFIVEQRDRIYGMDTSLGCDTCLLDDDYNEMDEKDLAEYREQYADELKRFAEDNGIEVDDEDFMVHFLTQTDDSSCARFNVTYTSYVDRWTFVTACFTNKEAERYIEENRHNLKEPRVFVASGYRNKEWIALRAALIELAK
jgi:hypothetical protein